ncbi:hypothetical protein Clacol_009865 [Clathrus columnatus]|uniref:Cytochrome P450 n=1 Tax=Clathrus columnatus TaxID=1419009 RepID=A0AAV5ALN5_9AGAM|nr:hypothetical protein Clacol_009865 [Clathrus columnatus]
MFSSIAPALSKLVQLFANANRKLILVNILVAFTVLQFSRKWRRNRLLPPGPRGLPFFGHYLRWPKSDSRFSHWPYDLAVRYNFGLVYIKNLWTEDIYINDYDMAIDILEKRSSSYSSRPSHIIANDIGTLGRHMLFMPYNEKWRKMRVAIHPEMTPTKVQSYVSFEEAETRIALHKILNDPASLPRYMRQIVGNVTLRIVYGMDSEIEHDKEFDEMTTVLYTFFGLANDQPVDIFPPARYLPQFLFPGYKAGMQLQAMTKKCFNPLMDTVIEKMNSSALDIDTAMAARWWRDRSSLGFDETDVSMLAGTMFEGATDTTTGLLMTFIVMSVSYPHVFKTAQAELDKVCGDHSPTVHDLSRSEYLKAVCKETLRWFLRDFFRGLPHMYTANVDDFYNGYRIPAGAILVPNNRAMTFNPKTYGQLYDVYEYEPRRWMDRLEGVGDGPMDEGLPTFGFGRRVCPGKNMAMMSFWILASNTMYYFDVGPKQGIELAKPVDSLGFWEGKADTSKFYITPREGRLTELERDVEVAKEYLRNL